MGRRRLALVRRAALGAVVAMSAAGLTPAPAASASTDATVVAWGENGSGQTDVPAGLSGVSAVAGGGAHSLALKGDGTVVGWGHNVFGQADVPAGLSGVISVAAGQSHSLALKGDGTVVVWGYNGRGQTDVPPELSGVVTAVAAGYHHNLALKSDGTVVAWGDNNSGQTDVPAGLSGVIAVAGGIHHSLALKGDGTVVAWGYNGDGQTDVPAGLSGVIAVAGGGLHSLALKGDGTVVAWGYNGDGQTDVPPELSGVIAVAGGGLHSLALKGDGTVVAWGGNTWGQTDVPAGLSGVSAVAPGLAFSLALKGGATPPDTVPPDGGRGRAALERAERAFRRVLRPVDQDNRSVFATYLTMAQAGATYDELLTRITRDYVTQAYDKIFRYRNDPAFSPVAKTAVPFNEEVYNRILTWVRAEGELIIDGTMVDQTEIRRSGAELIWTYVAKSAEVRGAHSGGVGKTNGEKCFGAMGPGCTGTEGLEGKGKEPHGVERFRRMDGLVMHYIDIAVAVGSIVHDRACLEDRDSEYDVAYCDGGPGDPQSGWMEKSCYEYQHECQGVREWWKASSNLFDERHWRYRFGPYPFVGFENPRKSDHPTGAVPGGLADSYQDDADNARVEANRPTWLPTTPPAGVADKSLKYPYSNGEAQMTTVLFAPLGTPIDYTDTAFCATGWASETQTEINTTPWKYCTSGTGGGGGGGDDKPPIHKN